MPCGRQPSPEADANRPTAAAMFTSLASALALANSCRHWSGCHKLAFEPSVTGRRSLGDLPSFRPLRCYMLPRGFVFSFAAATLIAAVAAGASGRSRVPRSAFPGVGPLERVDHFEAPSVDLERLRAEDEERERSPFPAPTRYAVSQSVSLHPESAGSWEELADGTHLWRLLIRSPGAQTMSLGMRTFDLPPDATFWVHHPDGSWVQGPYTVRDRNAAGGLWTAVVMGDAIVAELHVPRSDAGIKLEISSILHGYRGFDQVEATNTAKRGSCNVNVACPEGYRWADQIRAVARIAFTGDDGFGYLCSGQLMNNTAEDDTPYFLTAGHCIQSGTEAATVVAYWNYQTPSCESFFGGGLAQNQSGATLRARSDFDALDFALLELDDVPNPSFGVYFMGWDARDAVPQSSVSIHHPSGDQKSITFDADPPSITSYLGSTSPGDGEHLRVADWDLGTTEGGSSGSCLLDELSGLCVGTLSGGYAACGNDAADWYARLHLQFSGRANPRRRLADWLDPLGSGAEYLTGKDPGSRPTSQVWLIPAVASLPGALGSNWKSQVAVASTAMASRNATVYFVADGASWPGTILGGPYLIGPTGSLYLDDPLASQNPTSGMLYAMVDGDGTIAFSRTINLNDDGSTFGQGVPGILLDSAEGTTELILPMVHSVPGRYRTNVGFAQTSGGRFRVLISIYSADSRLLAEREYSIFTGWRQIDDIFSALGVGEVAAEGAWIRVRLVAGAPSFWTTYATIIDNTTNDPTYVLPVAP